MMLKTFRKIPAAISLISFFVLGFNQPLHAFSLRRIVSGPSETIREKNAFFEYDLSVQRGGAGKKYPLLLVLHGMGENPASVFTKWEAEASRKGIMVLVPNWIEAYRAEPKDLTELKKLLREIIRQYPVDKENLFVAGVSAGGRPLQMWIAEEPHFWRGCILAANVPQPDWFEKAKAGKMPALLFTYGEQDPGAQKDALLLGAAKLKRKGISVHLLIDPDAGHEVREEWMPVIMKWIEGRRYSTIA